VSVSTPEWHQEIFASFGMISILASGVSAVKAISQIRRVVSRETPCVPPLAGSRGGFT
jgi:hypothetical protein